MGAHWACFGVEIINGKNRGRSLVLCVWRLYNLEALLKEKNTSYEYEIRYCVLDEAVKVKYHKG